MMHIAFAPQGPPTIEAMAISYFAWQDVTLDPRSVVTADGIREHVVEAGGGPENTGTAYIRSFNSGSLFGDVGWAAIGFMEPEDFPYQWHDEATGGP